MTTFVPAPELILPWSSTRQEDSRFRKLLRNSLLVFAIIAVAIPFMPVPDVTREDAETLPPQLARVILEKKELPKPVPVKPKPELKKKVPPKKKPETKPRPEPVPAPKPQPVDLVTKARDQASVSGLLAFQDDLDDMRDSVDVSRLSKTNLSRGEAQAAKTERSIITSRATASSGGIQTAALSRDTGGSALSGKETTAVASPINQEATRKGTSTASAKAGGRSDESIRRIMDKNKGAIFAIYNRALRKDPTLQGKFVFELLVDPSGSISEITLISSDLGDDALDRKILSRVKLIRFPAENVIKTRVNYSFDFLPY